MKYILSLFCLLLFCAPFWSQSEFEISKIRKEKSSDYLEHSREFIKSLDGKYSGKLKKYLQANFEDMHIEFNKEILEGNLMFNDTVDNFVERILGQLKRGNKNLPEMKFYIAKDGNANAFAMGDNNMIINLGLFSFLESESEVAAVISHEIAHQMLEHNIETQINTYNSQQSKSYKEQLAQLRKSKYNTQNKALNLLKDHLYSLSANTRVNEYEADSLGYVLYQNTTYDKSEYLNALRTLEKYDTLSPIVLEKDTYRKYFDLKSQSFQEDWLKMEDFSNYNYSYKEKIDEDSIKSHPDVLFRIEKLQKIYPELNTNFQPSKASSDFEVIQEFSNKKRMNNLYDAEEYGDGIYFTLLNLQEDPENVELKNWLGEFFNKIYEARKDYTLNRYLERIDPENQSESYQQFLSFMWNLSLDEIKNIAEFYSSKEE